MRGNTRLVGVVAAASQQGCAIATDLALASDMIGHLVYSLRAAIPRLRSSGDSEATLGGQLEIVRACLGLIPGPDGRAHAAPGLQH